MPPGWEYSPSSWTQRLPIIALAFVGLYFSRYLTAYQLGNSDHLIGALVVTVSVTALAELGRAARYLNVLFGIALLIVPWILEGGTVLADVASVVAGLLLIVLALPRGRVRHSYGSWDRFIF